MNGKAAHTLGSNDSRSSTRNQSSESGTARRVWGILPQTHDHVSFFTFNLEGTIVTREKIYSLPGEPYRLLKPIPVKKERVGDNEILASFEEANIAISGESEEEAFQDLVGHILDVFEALRAEETRLGPGPARQMRVLNEYLATER